MSRVTGCKPDVELNLRGSWSEVWSVFVCHSSHWNHLVIYNECSIVPVPVKDRHLHPMLVWYISPHRAPTQPLPPPFWTSHLDETSVIRSTSNWKNLQRRQEQPAYNLPQCKFILHCLCLVISSSASFFPSFFSSTQQEHQGSTPSNPYSGACSLSSRGPAYFQSQAGCEKAAGGSPHC
jgi:hypothetical protein